MTRAKQSRSYSQRFFDLAEALSKHPDQPVRLTFADAKAAKAFRLEFYSFRACAERENLTETYPELSAITIVTNGGEVLVMHKDYTPSALALKAALEKVK